MATITDAHTGYWQRRQQAASERGRRMAQARWKMEKAERLSNPLDVNAETARERALHDRMGRIILAGTHTRLGRVEIRHSVLRTNGYEIWIEGRLAARTGKRKIMEALL